MQKNIAKLTIIGFVLFLLCDFWYYFNWFNVGAIIFHSSPGEYSLRDIIYNSDNFILLFFLFLSIRKCCPDLILFRAFCMWVMDLLATSMFYTIYYSPDIDSWSRWGFIIISTSIFLFQILWLFVKFMHKEDRSNEKFIR